MKNINDLFLCDEMVMGSDSNVYDEARNSLDNLYGRLSSCNDTIKKLRNENDSLKSEQYKDLELIELKKENEKLKAEMKSDFIITNTERKRLNDWINKHEFEKKHSSGGAIGGRYVYEFNPTSIGTFQTIKCTCGASFQFNDEL